MGLVGGGSEVLDEPALVHDALVTACTAYAIGGQGVLIAREQERT